MKNKVVLVPFPFDDFSATKMRPAICLTDKIGAYDHVIIAFISSQVPATLLPSDILVKSNHLEFSATGLRTNSVIRIHRIVSIRTKSIIRNLGVLGPNLQLEVASRIKLLFNV